MDGDDVLTGALTRVPQLVHAAQGACALTRFELAALANSERYDFNVVTHATALASASSGFAMNLLNAHM